jgi:hypothetical protein
VSVRKESSEKITPISSKWFTKIIRNDLLVPVSARDLGDRGISSVLTLEEIYGRSVSGWQTA